MTIEEVTDYFEHYRERKTMVAFKIKQGKRDQTVERLNAIEECMAGLPDGLGDILRMIYLDGKSLRQIAQKHYASKDTINRRKHEAIGIIAACLSDI